MRLVFVGFPPTKTGQKGKQTLQNRMMAVSKTIRAAAFELSDPKRMNASQNKRFIKWFGEKRDSDSNFEYEPVTNKISKLSHYFSKEHKGQVLLLALNIRLTLEYMTNPFMATVKASSVHAI